MAREKPEQQDVEEPDREIDPPEATDTADPERRRPRQWIYLNETATLSLPSGASYVFSAGDVHLMQPEDADFITQNGYGVKTGKPGGE